MCISVCFSLPPPLSKYLDINGRVDLEVYESLFSNSVL